MAQRALPKSPVFTAPMESTVLQFIQTGSAVIGYPISTLVPLVVTGVHRLIEDPNRADWSIKLERPGEDNSGPDDGLVRKTNGYLGVVADNKWFFHYRSTLESTLMKQKVDVTRHRSLLRSANSLYEECRGIAHTFAAAFDKALPGYGLLGRVLTAQSAGLDVLRILSYDQGSEIGKAHTDRNAFTFHIADSRSGLRIGEKRTPYEALPDSILVFPGDKLSRLTDGRIKPLIHDIVDTEQNATAGRWSIVYFAHIPGFIA